MTVLGWVKYLGGADLGDDGAAPDMVVIQFADNRFRRLFLRVRVIEDSGPVLFADIVTLAVKRGGSWIAKKTSSTSRKETTAGSKVTCTTST